MNDENLKNKENTSKEPTLSEIIEEVKLENEAPSKTSEFDFKKSNPSNNGNHKKLKITVCAIGGIFVLLMGILSGFLYFYNGIFPGVRVNGCSVSGMTINGAANLIETNCVKTSILKNEAIQLEISDNTYLIKMDTVTNGINSKKSAEIAYSYGRTGSYIKRARVVLSSMLFGHDLPPYIQINEEVLEEQLNSIADSIISSPIQPNYEIKDSFLVLNTGKPGIDYDKSEVYGIIYEKIRQIDFTPLKMVVKLEPQSKPNLDSIASDINCEPQNAYVDKNDKTYETIIPEKDGIFMDVNKAYEIVGDASEKSYKIPVKVTKPEITVEGLRAALFKDVLAIQSTVLNSNLKDRTTNVRLSAQFVNNTVLNPDDEFSFNEIVGPRTYARGFKDAKVFASGEVVDGVGGGICQTSSTIYMAALRADLKITNRFNHMFAVSYTPLGQDATVAYGSTDFKFVNDTPYPIKIKVFQTGNKVTVTLFGTKIDDKKTILSTEILSKTPFETIEKEDETLPYGTKKVEQGGYTGYKTVTYKTVTVNGKSTKTKVNTSNYKKLDKIILVGTKGAPPQKTAPQNNNEKTPVSSSPTDHVPQDNSPQGDAPQDNAPNSQLNQLTDPENT